jgi:hypothetical protein
MVNEQEMVLPENPKRPVCFRHLGSNPFCEGAAQTSKLSLTTLFSQQTSIFGFICSAKQKGLGTNLHSKYEAHLNSRFGNQTHLMPQLGRERKLTNYFTLGQLQGVPIVQHISV